MTKEQQIITRLASVETRYDSPDEVQCELDELKRLLFEDRNCRSCNYLIKETLCNHKIIHFASPAYIKLKGCRFWKSKITNIEDLKVEEPVNNKV